MFRLVFIDLDGTLLRTDHTLARSTRDAVAAVARRGVAVVLASARMPAAILPYYRQLELKSPIAAYNGAYVGYWGWSRPHRILDQRIPAPLIGQLWEIVAAAPGVSWSVYREHAWYVTNPDDPWVRQEELITGILAVPANLLGLLNGWRERGNGPHKLLAMGDPGAIDALATMVRQDIPALTTVRSKSTYLEICAPATSKAVAMESVREHLKIALADVLAIGDGDNDMSVLQAAGWGIAMGNAAVQVKEVANEITASNDNEGVEQAMMEHFLSHPASAREGEFS